MKPDEFDRALMDEMAQLPPDPGEAERCNPWRHAMSCMLWGMALMIIQFDFFYLNYLLPLLGSGLCYVGCRSLRSTSRWFRLAWVLSGLRLVFHVARIRRSRSVSQFAGGIESDTGFRSVGDYKTHFRLLSQLHEFIVLSVRIQCTADNVDHCQTIDSFSFIQSLQVYVIKIILCIQHVYHTFVDGLNYYNTAIEVSFFVHVINDPVDKCT